ncbi:MAG: hypothetical protein LCH38_03110 [Proteobacteria bacterium]|nr:hypothetical protein [Pseudomonadota bacterium]
MPISISLMLAILTVLRLLSFAIAALFGMLAIRAQFDAAIVMPWWQAILGAFAFLLTGLAAGALRSALARRAMRE